jgi:PAS domain S-box-containing protein
MGWSIFQGRLFDIVPVGHDTVIRNMPDGVIILDAHDQVLDINPAARQLVQRPLPDILGRPAREALDALRPLLAYGRQGDERIDEIELTLEGQAVFFDLYVTPIRRDGALLARLLVLRNVTARRRAQEDKLQAEKLKAALETTGAICHKLNQPLQGISGYAELLLMKVDPQDEAYAKIQGIQAETAKMGKITNKLLNITRYRTARYTAGETIVDIEESSGEN